MRFQAPSLPIPRRERWQPLRSGFVNLYRYDQEEFQYENGRLLLRGNNGTGKSRVLALQLPFLFDGEVNPERLEPDADPSKKMEWNLLMGRYPDRTGYTWIEFGRSDEGGKAHYLTIGCGLSASEGQSGVRQWFFTTTQRIGKDLELASDSKQVLGKDRLRGKIGSAGQVFETAADYRRAVNGALFRLDEYRYTSLMNLLIQLRRPQLTRRLEERELSRALSEALPPVSPGLVANVAEAFRVLESDRNQLTSSRSALAAVEQFLIGYRGYAEVAAKRRADRVLAAHDEYETAMKEILAAESECDRSLAGLALLKSEMQRLASEEHALQSEIAALQRNPNTHEALDLEQVHREAAEKRRDAERAATELTDSLRARKSCADENIRVRAKLEQHQLQWEAVKASSERAAMSSDLEELHRNCFESLDIHSADELDVEQAREKIAAAIRAQMEKVECLSILNERIEFAKREFQRASADRDQISGLLDDARERLNAARREHQAAVTSFLGAASDWTADLTELPLPFDESFLRSVGEWCDRPQGPNPFIAASRKVFEELILNFSGTRAELKQLEKDQYSELNRLETEHESIAFAESVGSPGSAGHSDASHHRRQMELQAAIADVHSRLDPVIDSIHELNRREGILRSEVHAAPPDDGVRTTYDYSVALSRHLVSVRSRMAEAEEYVSQKQSQVDQVMESRSRAASELGMTRWMDDLHAIKDGIVQYRLELSSVWSTVESLQEVRTTSAWTRTNLEQATARELRQREIATQLEQRAVAAEIARDAAGQTVNASSSEILERLSRARSRLESLRMEEKETRRRYHDTEVAVTRLDERLRSRTLLLNGDTDRRDSAASSFRVFSSTGLLKLAAPDLDGKDALTWSTTRTIEAAYELASRLGSIDAGDTAWEYHQKSVPSQFTTLMRALSAEGCKSSAVFRDDLFVATSFFAGEERSMDQLRQILLDDVSTRQLLLDARAGEILDNHLVGGVSSHLRELLLAAEEQVRQMNIELESRPMSTGMKLRFVWRPSEFAPSGMAEARQRLMQLDGAWSPAERQMLGMFLQQQIEAVFSDIEGASWQESLAEALDYRKWHQFGVERYQDGVWTRLTHRTFGTGSGGEKAVALTLPHFAAAAAFYRTADPLAPRLILLDEAFVGIDADMRAKCMGLIHVFDLDFIMTSEREWGCYQTLPGIAIYHLSTRPGIDAVCLSRWVWNGRQRSLKNDAKIAKAASAEPNTDEVRYESSEGSDMVAMESPQT
jgi:hypothetical protein